MEKNVQEYPIIIVEAPVISNTMMQTVERGIRSIIEYLQQCSTEYGIKGTYRIGLLHDSERLKAASTICPEAEVRNRLTFERDVTRYIRSITGWTILDDYVYWENDELLVIRIDQEFLDRYRMMSLIRNIRSSYYLETGFTDMLDPLNNSERLGAIIQDQTEMVQFDIGKIEKKGDIYDWTRKLHDHISQVLKNDEKGFRWLEIKGWMQYSAGKPWNKKEIWHLLEIIRHVFRPVLGERRIQEAISLENDKIQYLTIRLNHLECQLFVDHPTIIDRSHVLYNAQEAKGWGELDA